jgi:5-formyltetrahydrofolate cyclo-ligase
MAASAVTPKAVLRAAALARRDGLSAGARREASAAIARRCESVLAKLRFDCLAGFLPILSECDPRPIMAYARAAGATIALPAFLDRKTMVFRRYDDGDPLVPAGFGTSEPGAEAPVVYPDLLLVPAAAFDRSGARLGYGKGHYDRAIAMLRGEGHRPILLGLAFSVQEVDPIPVEPHDVRLDGLVTEKDVFNFRQNFN